jgi:hypothetical protein
MSAKHRTETAGSIRLDFVEPIIRDDRFEIRVLVHGEYGDATKLAVRHCEHGDWFNWREDETSAAYNRAYEFEDEIVFTTTCKGIAAARTYLRRFGAGNVQVLKQDMITGNWFIVSDVRRSELEWKDGQPDPVQAREPEPA